MERRKRTAQGKPLDDTASPRRKLHYFSRLFPPSVRRSSQSANDQSRVIETESLQGENRRIKAISFRQDQLDQSEAKYQRLKKGLSDRNDEHVKIDLEKDQHYNQIVKSLKDRVIQLENLLENSQKAECPKPRQSRAKSLDECRFRLESLNLKSHSSVTRIIESSLILMRNNHHPSYSDCSFLFFLQR